MEQGLQDFCVCSFHGKRWRLNMHFSAHFPINFILTIFTPLVKIFGKPVLGLEVQLTRVQAKKVKITAKHYQHIIRDNSLTKSYNLYMYIYYFTVL